MKSLFCYAEWNGETLILIIKDLCWDPSSVNKK